MPDQRRFAPFNLLGDKMLRFGCELKFFYASFRNGHFWRKAPATPWAAFWAIPSVAGASGTRARGRRRSIAEQTVIVLEA